MLTEQTTSQQQLTKNSTHQYFAKNLTHQYFNEISTHQYLAKNLAHQYFAENSTHQQCVTVPKMLDDTDTDTFSGTKYFRY